MTAYLYRRNIRIFDYTQWAEPLREEIRQNAERLAGENGWEIDFIRRKDFRKTKHGDHPLTPLHAPQTARAAEPCARKFLAARKGYPPTRRLRERIQDEFAEARRRPGFPEGGTASVYEPVPGEQLELAVRRRVLLEPGRPDKHVARGRGFVQSPLGESTA